MSISIGLYNKNLKMGKGIIIEEKICNIRGKSAFFRIEAGPLILGDQYLEGTHILEIDYQESEKVHKEQLGAFSFGACLYTDFAEKAHELASGFCKEHGFEIFNHVNSWPKYQAIVLKK